MTMSNVLIYLDSNLIIQEILYRYSHEANKILFALKTVRSICNFLNKNQISKSMLFFVCILLVKIKYQCKKIIHSLVNRENKFKFERFNLFVEAPKYEQVLLKFKRLLKNARIMESSLKNTHRFSFYLKQFEMQKFFAKQYNDKETKNMINLQLLYIIREKIFAKPSSNQKSIR